MAERIPHKGKPCPVCMGSAGARRLRRDTGASGEYSVAGSWSCYHIFPGRTGRKKADELSSIFRVIYTEYLKEKEPRKESRVLADLIEDAGELRKKCIERMPSYLKKVDEKAWWNEKTRKKMQQ